MGIVERRRNVRHRQGKRADRNGRGKQRTTGLISQRLRKKCARHARARIARQRCSGSSGGCSAGETFDRPQLGDSRKQSGRSFAMALADPGTRRNLSAVTAIQATRPTAIVPARTSTQRRPHARPPPRQSMVARRRNEASAPDAAKFRGDHSPPIRDEARAGDRGAGSTASGKDYRTAPSHRGSPSRRRGSAKDSSCAIR